LKHSVTATKLLLDQQPLPLPIRPSSLRHDVFPCQPMLPLMARVSFFYSVDMLTLKL